jgi:hypothetical protein
MVLDCCKEGQEKISILLGNPSKGAWAMVKPLPTRIDTFTIILIKGIAMIMTTMVITITTNTGQHRRTRL